MQNRVIVEIDLKALVRNYRKIVAHVRPMKVLSVLKANAYGLGVGAYAKALSEAGCEDFGVAEPHEALELMSVLASRGKGVASTGRTGRDLTPGAGTPSVQILSSILPDEIPEMVRAGVILPITDLATARLISAAAAKAKKIARVHFKLDTGMGRLGILASDPDGIARALETIRAVRALPNLDCEGIFTHCPMAYEPKDPFTKRQIALFKKILAACAKEGISFKKVHMAASDAINNFPETAKKPFTMVRTGINLHGSFDPYGLKSLKVEPVLTLKTRVAQVRELPAGTTLGYGRTWCLNAPAKVATISAGYADGLPLALTNRGFVFIGGRRCKIVGRISMDYTTVDVTDVPNVKAGDEVICFGKCGQDAITPDDWAALKGTHAYDIICSLGNRVQRVIRSAIVLACLAGTAAFAGDVKFAMPFSDGAVLQRDRSVPVWGTAEPGEKVEVSFGGKKVSATADAKGAWRVDLPTGPASKVGRDLTVTSLCGGQGPDRPTGASDNRRIDESTNRAILHDVLVGEVWLACGQSNMEFPLWSKINRVRDVEGVSLVTFVRRPFIRFLQTANRQWSATPVTTNAAKWVSLTPANVGDMSAVAFHFAEMLNRELDLPIGIIGAYLGATGVDPWTPREGYDLHPELASAKFKVTADWRDSMAKESIFGENQQPTVLYNAQIAPVVPYAMKGAIYYQGCSNALFPKDSGDYCARMHALYDGWKKVFENPSLKLYYVQIAPWNAMRNGPETAESWFDVQLQQARFAHEEPNSGMAVTSDVSSWDDIHPHEKRTVSRRLAMMAMKRDYGFKDIVCDSPEVKTAKVLPNGDVRLDFTGAVRGWFVYRHDRTTDVAFELQDADGKWHPASVRNFYRPTHYWDSYAGATEDAFLIVNWDPGTHPYKPKAIRYMHLPQPKGDLYTSDGLPLGPFSLTLK